MFWPQSQAFSMPRILVGRRRLGFLRKPWDAFGVGCCVVVFYNCCFELPFTNSLFAENATKQAGNELFHLHFHGFISPRRYYYFGLKFGFLRIPCPKLKTRVRIHTYMDGLRLFAQKTDTPSRRRPISTASAELLKFTIRASASFILLREPKQAKASKRQGMGIEISKTAFLCAVDSLVKFSLTAPVFQHLRKYLTFLTSERIHRFLFSM